MQSDTIKITIDTGADRTTFGLSIALLKARSPYLARKIQAALTPLHNPDGSLFVERNDEVEVRLRKFVSFSTLTREFLDQCLGL